MANNEPFEVDLTFTTNAGPAVQGVGQLAAVTKQTRIDVEAMSTAMDGVNDRAEKMRSYWTDNLELIEQAKSLLELMSNIEQGNQAMLNNNLVTVNEILSSVRGLGGNMGQAMQMLGAAGAGGWGAGGGGGGFYNQMMNDPFFGGNPTAPIDFREEPGHGGPGGPLLRGLKKGLNSAAERFKGFGRSPIEGKVDRSQDGFFDDDPTAPVDHAASRRGGFGGGGRIPPASRPTGGSDESSEPKKIIDPKTGFPFSYEDRTKAGYRPASITLKDQLKQYEHVDKAVPTGQEARAGITAINMIEQDLGKIFGQGPMGKRFQGHAQNFLQAWGGINRRNLRLETQSSFEDTGEIEDGKPVYIRTQGIIEGGVEEHTIKAANIIHKMLLNKAVSSVSSILGKANMAGAVFGAAQDVMGAVRGFTGAAQAQGDVFGQVDYGRSLSMGLQAQLKGGFGLNPFYSSAQVAQAQMAGAQLGLKGGDLQTYVNNTMTMQTKYGISGQEAQTFTRAALGAGISQNDNMAGIGTLRGLENNTNNLSTAYGNQSYIAGMSTGATMGLQGSAATQAGLLAAQFGEVSQVLQQAGINGTEGTGSQMINALTAQQLGVPYMSLYAAEQNLKGGTGGDKALMAKDKGIMSILSNLGIKPDAIKKKSDLNPYAMELSMILPQIIGDQKLASPQLAKEYVWAKIQEMNRIKTDEANARKPKPKEGSAVAGAFGWLEHAVTNVVTGVGGAALAVVNTVNSVKNTVEDETGGLLTGQTQTEINKRIAKDNKQLRDAEHSAGNWIDNNLSDQALHKQWNQENKNLEILVGMTPGTQQHITAVVQSQNNARTTASGPPLNTIHNR